MQLEHGGSEPPWVFEHWVRVIVDPKVPVPPSAVRDELGPPLKVSDPAAPCANVAARVPFALAVPLSEKVLLVALVVEPEAVQTRPLQVLPAPCSVPPLSIEGGAPLERRAI